MALNASGPISLAGSTTGQSIAVELGLGATTAISLNQAAVRTLAGVASGAIIMPTNFWGKSSSPPVEYLVVAGGGGGGGGYGGAGGAGGYRTASGFAVASGTPLTVTVGAGGTAVCAARTRSGANDCADSGQRDAPHARPVAGAAGPDQHQPAAAAAQDGRQAQPGFAQHQGFCHDLPERQF